MNELNPDDLIEARDSQSEMIKEYYDCMAAEESCDNCPIKNKLCSMLAILEADNIISIQHEENENIDVNIIWKRDGVIVLSMFDKDNKPLFFVIASWETLESLAEMLDLSDLKNESKKERKNNKKNNENNEEQHEE